MGFTIVRRVEREQSKALDRRPTKPQGAKRDDKENAEKEEESDEWQPMCPLFCENSAKHGNGFGSLVSERLLRGGNPGLALSAPVEWPESPRGRRRAFERRR
jgi:hypothetical protein